MPDGRSGDVRTGATASFQPPGPQHDGELAAVARIVWPPVPSREADASTLAIETP